MKSHTFKSIRLKNYKNIVCIFYNKYFKRTDVLYKKMSQHNHDTELSQQITEVVQKSVDGLVKKLTSIFLKRDR